MLRAIYVVLLRLHPRFFRREFAEEMLWIFDQASNPGRAWALIGDAVQSLATQWMFRTEGDQSPALAAVDRVPGFYTLEPDMPPPGALLNGVVGSIVVFGLACFALAHSGVHNKILTYYSDDFRGGPSAGGDAVAGPPMPGATARPSRQSLVSALLDAVKSLFHKTPKRVAAATTMNPAMARETVIAKTTVDAALYFRTVPILAALDTNHDGVISAEEIANAPAVLAALDKNHDGKLDPEECGLAKEVIPQKFPDKMKNPVQEQEQLHRRWRVQREFMRLEPVLAALDADRDAIISAAEIRNAPMALALLDRNHDGRLTLNEVQHDPVAHQVATIFRMDTNFDGKISPAERLGPIGRHYKELLDAADTNHDGYVTEDELAREFRRREDLNGDGVVTWEEMMQAGKAGKLANPPENTPHSVTR